MIMTCKWLLGLILMGWLTTNMSIKSVEPVPPDPIQVLITCMSVLNVMSDHVPMVERVLWQHTATNIHAWLWMHVPVKHHEQMHQLQHVLETHIMYHVMDMPHMMPIAQAHNCHNSLVHMFSMHT